MTETQKKIFKNLRWFFFILMLGIIAVQFLPYFFPAFEPTAHKLKTFFGSLEHLIITLLFILFAFVVAGLIIHFIQTEKKRNAEKPLPQDIILELKKPNEWIGKFILFFVISGFVGGMNFMLFKPDFLMEAEELKQIDTTAKLFFGLFYVIAHFLFVHFTLQLFRNHSFFIATKDGFIYEPGHVSAGLVRWDNIAEIRETEVLYGNSNTNGPRMKPALGIKLKDPEAYNQGYNPILKQLVAFGNRVNNYQTEGAGDILLDPSDFGKRYEEVKELLFKHQNGYRK